MTKHAPTIILVRPQMGENIGMVARAMHNCGITDLRLVAPRDGWPNAAAIATASNATMILDNATLYPDLRAAIADQRFVIGSGSFARDMVKQVLCPETAAQTIITTNAAAGENICALVFGCERSGLDNDDVTLCDAYLTVPLNPAYPSLNLAQAVLLVAYHWYVRTSPQDAPQLPLAAPKEMIFGVFDHLVAALDRVGFFKTAAQRPVMVRNLRNTFQRLQLNPQEVQTLRGMIKAFEKASGFGEETPKV